jgi:hypothetical protein
MGFASVLAALRGGPTALHEGESHTQIRPHDARFLARQAAVVLFLIVSLTALPAQQPSFADGWCGCGERRGLSWHVDS